MIMNGIKKPNCFKEVEETTFYDKEISPYELPPKSNLNIGALSNYLVKNYKTIYTITKEEVEQFLIK